MGKILTFKSEVEPFVLFSKEHWMAITVIVVVGIMIFTFREKLRQPAINKKARLLLGGSLIVQEIGLNVYRVSTNQWTLATSLPVHLCAFSVIAGAIMMYNKSYKIFEIAYFWGLGGATNAILTPDVNVGFPHFRFYQFFLSHGLIIMSVLFMTFVHSYRPQLGSIWKTLKLTNLLMIPVALINYLTGGNYFFIAHKPETASLLDYLGPWPWYILALELIAVVMFILCYLPFGVSDIRQQRSAAKISM